MDVEKLIDRLKNYSIKDKALLNLQTVKDAAEALEKLQAENESLKNKLHDSYQGHLLDVVIPRLEAELEKAKMARPIELTGKGAEAFALAAELSETKQELEKVKAERDAYKIYFDDLSSKPDCNTCDDKDCRYRPRVGAIVRVNCPFWCEKEE